MLDLSQVFHLFSTIFTQVMKNLFIAAILLLLSTSCQKALDPIIIPKETPFEVMPVRLTQNVLLEHFSDESKSSTISDTYYAGQLAQKFPGRLYITNFHLNDFLATSYSNYLATLLGGLINVSKGAINRQTGIQTSGQEDGLIWLSPVNWEAAIKRALKTNEAPLALSIETGVAANGKGYVNIFIAHREIITADTRIMIYLVEDNIQPIFQVDMLPGFLHQNVFMDVIPSFEGQPVDLSYVEAKGSIKKLTFQNIVLEKYNLVNLKIIALAYSNHPDFNRKQILNVQEAHFYGNHYWDVE